MPCALLDSVREQPGGEALLAAAHDGVYLVGGDRLGVDSQDHALGAEHAGELVYQLGALKRCRVDRDLVRAGVQH